MSYIYFDIETLPDMSDGAQDRAKENVKVPGNYKNPDTIAAYIEENAHEAWARTALDGFKGHVCAIGVDNGSKASVQVIGDVSDEADLIRWFFDQLKPDRQLVGHCIITFDIKFITKRALALGIKLPMPYLWPRNLKPWDTAVFDTGTIFGAGQDMISLNTLAHGLGLEPKINHGGAVLQMWQDGLKVDIGEYCLDDVRIVKQAHQKLLRLGW